MSRQDLLARAITARLGSDGTLVGLAPGGVWCGRIPNLAHVHPWTWAGTAPVIDTSQDVLDPTWLEFAVVSGGTEEYNPGEWTDVVVQVAAKSRRGPAAAFRAEARADALLYGWQPSLSGLASLATDKTGDDHTREIAGGDVGQTIWVQSGLWRFRYGPP